MCGINGIVYKNRDVEPTVEALVGMRDSQTHRGPDDAGYYLAPGVGLGSRRLAILDLSPRGHMPMCTPDGRFQIVYNGEVYNYLELRSALEARGHVFRSNTDTEVILNLYAVEGPKMLDRLNGMFAFAIWDARERNLFIARDRMGIKPLYYAEQNGDLYFASEAKALFAAGIEPVFDEDTWEELLYFRYIAGERTPYRGVRRLLPGHYMNWRDGVARTDCWWKLSERALTRKDDLPSDSVGWFRETFDSSVNLRRISDVPVGVLLSGGLDSSNVAASLAMQSETRVSSYTVRFDEPKYDEGPLARQVAERWGLDHHELKLNPGDLLSMLYDASRLNDEPLVHGNDLYLLAISKYAKSNVTVILSGEGADETLGGYVRYRPLQYPALLGAARAVFTRTGAAGGNRGRIGKLARFLKLGDNSKFVLFNSCDTLPGEVEFLEGAPKLHFPYRESVLAEAKALYPKEPARQAMYSDQHAFLCSILDRNDRMTMGASIECRVPFLDHRLVETLAALPTSSLLSKRVNKRLLREALNARLPEDVRNGRKWGFSVPWSHYFRHTPELRELVESLPTLSPVREGPFKADALRRVIDDFLAGGREHESTIRQLVMVTVWYKAMFEGTTRHEHRQAAKAIRAVV